MYASILKACNIVSPPENDEILSSSEQGKYYATYRENDGGHVNCFLSINYGYAQHC